MVQLSALSLRTEVVGFPAPPCWFAICASGACTSQPKRRSLAEELTGPGACGGAQLAGALLDELGLALATRRAAPKQAPSDASGQHGHTALLSELNGEQQARSEAEPPLESPAYSKADGSHGATDAPAKFLRAPNGAVPGVDAWKVSADAKVHTAKRRGMWLVCAVLLLLGAVRVKLAGTSAGQAVSGQDVLQQGV